MFNAIQIIQRPLEAYYGDKYTDARWNNWVDDTENSALVSAPNLTHFGTHNACSGIKELNHENLVEWIADPSIITGYKNAKTSYGL